MRAAISVLIAAGTMMLGACSIAPTASEHGHHHGASGSAPLGEVSFETTCAPEAHKAFNKGMLYQHSRRELKEARDFVR